MFPAGPKYNWSVIGLMAVYSALCFVVPEVMKNFEGRGPLAILIAASPAYPIVGVLYLYIKQLNVLDELEQRIQLLSLAIATGLTLIGVTAYGFIVVHLNTPEFPMILILPVFILVWFMTALWIKRGYR